MSIAMSPRRRLVVSSLLVAVVGVLAVGSFVVLRNDDGSGTGGRTLVGPGPTTISPDPNLPPALANTGEDWDQIVRSMRAYQQWLFTHPKPELLDNIMLRTYDDYDGHKLGLTNLATKGWHYDPPFRAATVEVVRLQDRPRPDLAVVFVRSFTPPNRVVDASGKVISDDPGAGEASVLWTLQREPATDAHWRLAKVTPFADTPARS